MDTKFHQNKFNCEITEMIVKLLTCWGVRESLYLLSKIAVILNGLPWKWTEIILLFLRLHPSTAFWTLLLTMRAPPFLLAPWKKSYGQPRQHIKKQRHYFTNKGPSSQGYGFSSSHVWMWELDYKESWVQENWCFWSVVLEKTLASPLDCKEIQAVSPKGNQSWIFIGRTDAEAEAPILWAPDAKNWLIGKDPDAGKDWGQEKGMTEHEMVGWHHWLDGHEFE